MIWQLCARDLGRKICIGDKEPYTTIPRTISKLPIFIFSFTCHQSISFILDKIRQRSQTRLTMIVLLSICSTLTLFATIAPEGYFTYGSKVMGYILLKYPLTPKLNILRYESALHCCLSCRIHFSWIPHDVYMSKGASRTAYPVITRCPQKAATTVSIPSAIFGHL